MPSTRRCRRSSPPGDGGRVDLSQYLQLVRKLDEYLQDNTGKTLQSMEIAGQFGVSVRTLNNAVVAIRGLSLHRYTRLRRLWRVRQQLVQGAAAESLKAIALANGFWHMGEFRTLYRDLFGETPQQTLEAARAALAAGCRARRHTRNVTEPGVNQQVRLASAENRSGCVSRETGDHRFGFGDRGSGNDQVQSHRQQARPRRRCRHFAGRGHGGQPDDLRGGDRGHQRPVRPRPARHRRHAHLAGRAASDAGRRARHQAGQDG